VNQVDPGVSNALPLSQALHILGPNNSLGNEIIQTTRPWEHDSFWPYIIQSLLRGHLLPAASFIRTLSKHTQSSVSRLATLLSTHLTLCPRSTDTAAYPLDHQYLQAHRNWLSRFRAELAATTGGQGRSGKLLGEGSGEWTTLEAEFRTVVDLMEGSEEAVLVEAGSWREAVGAWGLLVDVGLRRDDLP
jgi:nuclear pore complex protein Nup85